MFNFKEGAKRIWYILLIIYYLVLSPTVYDFVRFRNPNDTFIIVLLVIIPLILKLIFNYIVEGFKKK
jgi:hypothetical protein